MINWKITLFENLGTAAPLTFEAMVVGKRFVVTRLHLGQGRHSEHWYVSYAGWMDNAPTKAAKPEAAKLEAVAMLAERAKRILAEIES